MQDLGPKTTIHALLKAHPFLLDFLADYHREFRLLKNPVARAAMARAATLEKAAGLAGVPVERLVDDIRRRIGQGTAAEADPGRIGRLKEIIRMLHAGRDVDAARAEFADLIREVEPTDIARMEQELIRDGMPVEEIHRLCDLHVNVFQAGLERQETLSPPPGHPLHTYQAENREIARRAQRWADLCRGLSADAGEEAWADLREALDHLAKVEVHYTRKENQLFPYLEKAGFTGPSQVMWALHDDVRRMVKDLRGAIDGAAVDPIRETGVELARVVSEMIYKEEKNLFPNAWKLLKEDEWRAIRFGDDEIGYVVEPAASPESLVAPDAAVVAEDATESGAGLIPLTTGALTREQLDRMLTSMPVEFSFVDDQDTVRYYSGQPERVFPRSPGVIGRKVQNCHPRKSLDQVNAILAAFRDGSRDSAEFWIPFQGKFLYITYHAVRDAAGRYLGTLEVTMDATRIRQLEGERRLLEWS